MRPTDFATRLTGFLGEYLPSQKNLSANTIRAYRDVLTLFLRYCRDQRGFSPEQVELKTVDAPFVLDFLNHLETERKCSARTRNHRLSALHSFFRYLQTEDPALLVQCQQILAISFKRCARPSVNYLSTEELQVVLAQPDLTTASGRRDAVLLSVLYDTGARVQEVVDLDVRDVRLSSPAQIQLTGKGHKQAITGNLIMQLNPVIRGWAQYHQHGASKRTFAKIDHHLFTLLWQWARRRHPRKSLHWSRDKYFRSEDGNNWVFFGHVTRSNGTRQDVRLFRASSVAIRRHTKIKGEANPYDPQWEPYFEARLGLRMAHNLKGRRQLLRLWKEQDGLCRSITCVALWGHRVFSGVACPRC